MKKNSILVALFIFQIEIVATTSAPSLFSKNFTNTISKNSKALGLTAAGFVALLAGKKYGPDILKNIKQKWTSTDNQNTKSSNEIPNIAIPEIKLNEAPISKSQLNLEKFNKEYPEKNQSNISLKNYEDLTSINKINEDDLLHIKKINKEEEDIKKTEISPAFENFIQEKRLKIEHDKKIIKMQNNKIKEQKIKEQNETLLKKELNEFRELMSLEQELSDLKEFKKGFFGGRSEDKEKNKDIDTLLKNITQLKQETLDENKINNIKNKINEIKQQKSVELNRKKEEAEKPKRTFADFKEDLKGELGKGTLWGRNKKTETEIKKDNAIVIKDIKEINDELRFSNGDARVDALEKKANELRRLWEKSGTDKDSEIYKTYSDAYEKYSKAFDAYKWARAKKITKKLAGKGWLWGNTEEEDREESLELLPSGDDEVDRLQEEANDLLAEAYRLKDEAEIVKTVEAFDAYDQAYKNYQDAYNIYSKAFDEYAKNNLKKANAFLKKYSKMPYVVAAKILSGVKEGAAGTIKWIVKDGIRYGIIKGALTAATAQAIINTVRDIANSENPGEVATDKAEAIIDFSNKTIVGILNLGNFSLNLLNRTIDFIPSLETTEEAASIGLSSIGTISKLGIDATFALTKGLINLTSGTFGVLGADGTLILIGVAASYKLYQKIKNWMENANNLKNDLFYKDEPKRNLYIKLNNKESIKDKRSFIEKYTPDFVTNFLTALTKKLEKKSAQEIFEEKIKKDIIDKIKKLNQDANRDFYTTTLKPFFEKLDVNTDGLILEWTKLKDKGSKEGEINDHYTSEALSFIIKILKKNKKQEEIIEILEEEKFKITEKESLENILKGLKIRPTSEKDAYKDLEDFSSFLYKKTNKKIDTRDIENIGSDWFNLYKNNTSNDAYYVATIDFIIDFLIQMQQEIKNIKQSRIRKKEEIPSLLTELDYKITTILDFFKKAKENAAIEIRKNEIAKALVDPTIESLNKAITTRKEEITDLKTAKTTKENTAKIETISKEIELLEGEVMKILTTSEKNVTVLQSEIKRRKNEIDLLKKTKSKENTEKIKTLKKEVDLLEKRLQDLLPPLLALMSFSQQQKQQEEKNIKYPALNGTVPLIKDTVKKQSKKPNAPDPNQGIKKTNKNIFSLLSSN